MKAASSENIDDIPAQKGLSKEIQNEIRRTCFPSLRHP